MEFEPGTEPGLTAATLNAAATQAGEHLHIAFRGGGDLYIAGTTLAEVEAGYRGQTRQWLMRAGAGPIGRPKVRV